MSDRVHTTKNFGLFRVHELNRKPKEGKQNWLKLEQSLIKDGWWETEPMIVYPRGRDGKHVIVKGHHRFLIAKKHNIPICFQVDDQRVEIWRREGHIGNGKWSQGDWVESHISHGKNKNYKIIAEFNEQTGIPMSACITLFSEGRKYGQDVGEEVRSGELRISDYSFPRRVGELVMHCRSLEIPYATKTGFVRALAMIVRTGVVDTEALKQKITTNIGVMRRKWFNSDYLGILNEVYNYRMLSKIDLKTEIGNVMTARKRALSGKAGRAAQDKRRAKEREMQEQAAQAQ